MFSRESSLVGGLPYAQCYGEHQFGSWAGKLGDGIVVLRSMRGGGIVVLMCGRWLYCVYDFIMLLMVFELFMF
ncbi:hypothetical protein GIB67_028379 [Kingdonia uniflora]|uniref:Uncharacterized protein n=1 Tax=Kingdonia uniflora TaxID=39325 RepID=A0A7J7MHY6_9MAGN|nr:hypothetical protein GIB67_028379 [Kingdonia uniflora]